MQAYKLLIPCPNNVHPLETLQQWLWKEWDPYESARAGKRLRVASGVQRTSSKTCTEIFAVQFPLVHLNFG